MIRMYKHLLFLFLISFASSLVFAQVPGGGTMLNTETGTTYSKIGKCTATTVAVTDQEFTKAVSVVVGTDVANTWDAQLSFPAVGGLAKDDLVLVAFYGPRVDLFSRRDW